MWRSKLEEKVDKHKEQFDALWQTSSQWRSMSAKRIDDLSARLDKFIETLSLCECCGKPKKR